MRKTSLILFLLICNILSAQTVESVGWVSKFGLAGGVTPIWVFQDFTELQTQLKDFGVGELPGLGMFTIGGGGYAYIMFVDNLRIGGMGYSGSISRTGKVNGYHRELDYSIGGGVVTIEYTIPSIKGIALSVGAMIGGGSLDIELYNNNSSFDWNDVIGGISDPNSTDNYNRKITHSYFMINPTVNLDVPVNRFMALRIGAGYQFTFGDEWSIENNQKLTNVPSDLNKNSFFIQTGLFFGFFAF